jgi:hypothetical protein
MADRTRTITLRVNDQFSRELKEYTRQMDSATESTEKLGRAGSGQGRFGGFKQASQDLFFMGQSAMMVANHLGGILNRANELARIGIGAERSKMALEGLAGGAENAAKWIDAINAGAHGSLTSGEAAATGYRLMRFGLADTAEEAQKFIDTVSKVAMVNPQLGGTEEAINQIQLTLSNMSYMRLDQLGVSAGEVRKRIQELKNETAGLSDEEYFSMAVMEQLDEQVAALGDEFIELDDATQRLNAWARGFKEDAGRRVAQGIEGIAEGVMGLKDALDDLGAEEFTIRLLYSIGFSMFGKRIPTDLEARTEEFRTRYGGAPQTPADFRDESGLGAAATDFLNAVNDYATESLNWAAGLVMGGAGEAPGGPAGQLGIASTSYWWQRPFGAGGTGTVKAGEGAQILNYDWMRRLGYSEAEIADMERMFSGMQGMRGGNVAFDYPWARIAGPENFRGMRAAGYDSPEVQQWQQMYMEALSSAYAGADQPTPETLRRLQTQNIAKQRFLGNRSFMQGLTPFMFGGGDTLGLNYQVGQMGGLAMRGVEQQIPNLLKIRDTIGEIAGRWADVASAAFDAITPAERSASLSEKFGLDPHTFDLEVYDRMKDAMEEAEVNADFMSDAMRRYEHETGMANAQSEIFDAQMMELAERLKIGQLTAQEYVNAVSGLVRMDLSNIDRMMAPLREMDMDAYLTVLDRIKTLSPDLLPTAANLPFLVQGAVSKIQDSIWGLQGGGRVEEMSQRVSPLEPMITDLDVITDRFATAETDWGTPVTSFVNLATGEFTRMELAASGDIETIETELTALSEKEFTVRLKVQPYFSPGMDAATKAFAGGGYGEVSYADVIYETVNSETQRRNQPSIGGAQVP